MATMRDPTIGRKAGAPGRVARSLTPVTHGVCSRVTLRSQFGSRLELRAVPSSVVHSFFLEGHHCVLGNGCGFDALVSRWSLVHGCQTGRLGVGAGNSLAAALVPPRIGGTWSCRWTKLALGCQSRTLESARSGQVHGGGTTVP